VIGTDGKVAQQGTYKDLAADSEGAFAKLMEWQMSGGSTTGTAPPGKGREVDPELTEQESMKMRLEEHDGEQGVEVEEAVEEEGKEKATADVRAGESEGEKKQ
jgi:putative ABC transport system ATP-binding protein